MFKGFIEQNVKWFGQFSLMFTFGKTIIFIDPFNLPKEFSTKADYIFITHSHYDHFSPENINKIVKKDTKFYVPKDVAEKLREENFSEITELMPGEHFKIDNISVETIPMYNIKKTKFHPKENNWFGFFIKYNDINIYISGDTERIPEMKQIETDIAFLPIGQVYTMNNVEEAILCAEDVKAKLVIPVHFGMYEGSKADAEYFCNLAKKKGIDCMILTK